MVAFLLLLPPFTVFQDFEAPDTVDLCGSTVPSVGGLGVSILNMAKSLGQVADNDHRHILEPAVHFPNSCSFKDLANFGVELPPHGLAVS